MIESLPVKTRQNPRGAWTRILFCAAFAATSASLSAQISLGTIVDLTQRNSGAVRLAEADVRKAEAALAQSKDALVPSLDVASGLPTFPTVGFSGGVPSILSGSVQAMVLSFPQKQYILAAQSGLKAAKLSLDEAREQVVLDASTAYIELDAVDRQREAAKQQETEAARLVEIEQARAEAGVDPVNDLLQARLTAAQIKLARLHLDTRVATLTRQLANLTGLPVGAIATDRASIPEIPPVRASEAKANEETGSIAGIESARMFARSRQQAAKGDALAVYLPQSTFFAQYNRSTKLLNNAAEYYNPAHPLPTTNFSSGISIQLPLFDLGLRDKAKQSAADALRATVEAEQAQRQDELQIATLTGTLRELDTLAEIASLKQQIAVEQLKTVESQMELGNGASGAPGAPPQLTPKAEQLARIDERQKYQDALNAEFELSKARLSLLRALGHMDDWLRELRGK